MSRSASRIPLPVTISESLRRAAGDILIALRLRHGAGSWVLPGAVLACAYPRDDAALAELRAAGVRLLVNLHRRGHAAPALARHGLAQVHLPTRDFAAPGPAALRAGVRAIEGELARGGRVAVHCGGGRGRTGTLLACLLVARGYAPEAAIACVRRARAGSVETRAQVAAVRAFAAAAVPPRWYPGPLG